MGTKIHRSAKVDVFVREFDLVDIGSESSIEYSIGCHKFSPEGKPTISTLPHLPFVFAPFQLGINA